MGRRADSANDHRYGVRLCRVDAADRSSRPFHLGHSSVTNAVMSREFDVAVVGCGIVGAACAAELAGAGDRVVVLEQGPIGGGATAAGMGHVVVMDDSPAQLALTSYSRRLWHALVPQLARRVPNASGAARCGSRRMRRRWRPSSASGRSWPGPASRPRSSPPRNSRGKSRICAAAWPADCSCPDDLVVYPPVVAQYLLDQAVSAGADDPHGGPRRAQCGDDGSVQLPTARRFARSLVINATGSWAPALTPGLPIRPRKGHLVITDRYPGFRAPPVDRTGVSEKRTGRRPRVGRVQYSAAQDRADADRLLASIRCRETPTWRCGW